MKIIMLGAPGAGKGSQASRISKVYQLPHISTGDIFRANIKGETELGLKAKAFIDHGELVPDEVTIAMLLNRLEEKDCAKGYILDGFPRTIPQAIALENALAPKGEKIDLALDVEVPDDVIIHRMAGRRTCPHCGAIFHLETLKPQKEGICDNCGAHLVQRKDDEENTVMNRLKVYHESTEPLISFYKKEGILEEIDGTKDLETVFSRVKEILASVERKLHD